MFLANINKTQKLQTSIVILLSPLQPRMCGCFKYHVFDVRPKIQWSKDHTAETDQNIETDLCLCWAHMSVMYFLTLRFIFIFIESAI